MSGTTLSVKTLSLPDATAAREARDPLLANEMSAELTGAGFGLLPFTLGFPSGSAGSGRHLHHRRDLLGARLASRNTEAA